MSTRAETFAALDGERDYQDDRWGDNAKMSLGDFVVYADAYLARMKAQLTFSDPMPSITDLDKALHTLRKITALGVAAMEQHGAIPRL
jgi:hypothetical protein